MKDATKRARRALKPYLVGCDTTEALTDLLTDLRLTRADEDFEEALRCSDMHYDNERVK